MKNTRLDQRRATLRYRHDADSGRTVVIIDLDAPEDDMPHEHRRDMKLLAEEILGVPVDSLPEGIEVQIRRKSGDHSHDHDHDHAHDHEVNERVDRSEKSTS